MGEDEFVELDEEGKPQEEGGRVDARGADAKKAAVRRKPAAKTVELGSAPESAVVAEADEAADVETVGATRARQRALRRAAAPGRWPGDAQAGRRPAPTQSARAAPAVTARRPRWRDN